MLKQDRLMMGIIAGLFEAAAFGALGFGLFDTFARDGVYDEPLLIAAIFLLLAAHWIWPFKAHPPA